MERGVNNWKLTIQRGETEIAILRARTCDETAVLPETLFGLPVTVLGNHALSPMAGDAEGETVEIQGGPCSADAPWDNRTMRELTFPPTLRRVGDYALFNCASLKTLHLWDSVAYWGGGALMNCRALDTFHLTRTGEQGESLSYFADELSRELDVTIVETDGQTARLLFPEFVELYEENCPAHHFDYNIYGAGYPYHHCFRQKRLKYADYDNLWKGFLGMEHDETCAMRLAWQRLRYPVELSERAETAYRTYLSNHTGTALQWLTEQRDAQGLSFLLGRTSPSREELSTACETARTLRASDCLAVLLEAQHQRFPVGEDRCFDL